MPNTERSTYYVVRRSLLSVHESVTDAKAGDYLITSNQGEIIKVSIKPGVWYFNPEKFDSAKAIKMTEPE